MKNITRFIFFLVFYLISVAGYATNGIRIIRNFNEGWKFHLGDIFNAQLPSFNDNSWRKLDLPHDWSIEGSFNPKSLAEPGGGYLDGGIGWYRKTFVLDKTLKSREVYVDFDGVYRNSTVWINGHKLGFRPYGYISFRYDLNPYVYFDKPNVIAVKVDNSQQPNSRWYSGSGIYRNVRLVLTNKTHFDHWGTFVSTPIVDEDRAFLKIIYSTIAQYKNDPIVIYSRLYDNKGKLVAQKKIQVVTNMETTISMLINKPHLWSVDDPYLYTLVSSIYRKNQLQDQISTNVGIRYFNFDPQKGFFLNGKSMKILGVCLHHDLGCLGSAVNKRAIERQLEILKRMGCNAIRTSHNPPAPELLDLADHMGFLVMDEAFDMWKMHKTTMDVLMVNAYSKDFQEWHRRDLLDFVRRDRNHPCVIIWSLGNEVPEQYCHKNDSLSDGSIIMKELCSIVRSIDTTRPIVTANNNPNPDNPLISCNATDLIGINYHDTSWLSFPKTYPGKKLIITESTSALETRGWYQMPSDSILRVPFSDALYTTPTYFCSAYDNCSTPSGSTHEETWKIVKKHPYISGMFIWTGFDYIGEPTPYIWPARSSYFGIVDLAGFPKDVYYMYQSEWSHKAVLHIFPHWNWHVGQTVDVWAYYNNADEVELFLNGKSLGKRTKSGNQFHVMWRVPFSPGVLRAISYKNGKRVMETEEKTSGPAARMTLSADRGKIKSNNSDLSFITVQIVDKNGIFVPTADNLVKFSIAGPGKIVGVNNGSEIDHNSFKSDRCKTFFGKCIVVIQSTHNPGVIHLKAVSKGLPDSDLHIITISKSNK